jgi:hypothetical protein
MASIVYKSLSSLSPVELKYEYYKDEQLKTSYNTYKEGYIFYETESFKNYQDVAINKGSCFILTSSISLSSVFTPADTITIGKFPVSILIQPRSSSIYYATYNTITNTIRQVLSSETPSVFYLAPIGLTDEVEIFVNNRYIQVTETYPYTVYTAERSLDPEEIHRQRFKIVYQGGFITFKTKTNSGYRYLCFNNDGIMRATGVVLNETIINDYVFKCLPVTTNTLQKGFIPTNDWVTYYFDIESEAENKTVTINKNIQDTPTNFLIDFPVERVFDDSEVNVNVANLKTNLTPAGGPAPVDNSYTKNVITTN